MSGGISDSELHAFVDGALTADETRRLAALIAADDALAARVAAFRADKAMLQQIFRPVAEQPVPAAWLALAQGAPKAPASSWHAYAAIAAMLIMVVAMAAAYWRTTPQPPGEIVAAALAARTAPGPTIIDVAAGGGADRYGALVSKAVALKLKVPDLKKMGYQLAGIQLYPGAAELRYRDKADRLFTLYLRRSDGAARFDQFQRGDLRICIWQDDQLGMVMAGNVSTAAMQRLASLAYTGLTL